jgi:hypothetical protein
MELLREGVETTRFQISSILYQILNIPTLEYLLVESNNANLVVLKPEIGHIPWFRVSIQISSNPSQSVLEEPASNMSMIVTAIIDFMNKYGFIYMEAEYDDNYLSVTMINNNFYVKYGKDQPEVQYSGTLLLQPTMMSSVGMKRSGQGLEFVKKRPKTSQEQINLFSSTQNYVPQVRQQPTYQQPTYQQPTYQQPTYQQPTYQQPTYQQPTYQQPTYQQPTYQQSSLPLFQQLPPLTQEDVENNNEIVPQIVEELRNPVVKAVRVTFNNKDYHLKIFKHNINSFYVTMDSKNNERIYTQNADLKQLLNIIYGEAQHLTIDGYYAS